MIHSFARSNSVTVSIFNECDDVYPKMASNRQHHRHRINSTGQQHRIKNKAAIALKCKVNGMNIAALIFIPFYLRIHRAMILYSVAIIWKGEYYNIDH